MTKEQFQKVCGQVFVSLVGDMLHKQFIDLNATQDVNGRASPVERFA